MMEERPAIYIGTMGWTYKDWVGVFYPDDAQPREYLRSYSQVFNALEIDSTFYFIPKASIVTGWKAQTPPGFVFTAKFPKEMTHEKGLVDVDDQLALFLKNMSLLDEKLGCLLVQLPPSFRHGPAEFDTLARFLDKLPSSDIRFAVEFRHRSWVKPEVYDLLRARRLAWTMIDHPWYMPVVPEITADFTYIRWLGDNNDPKIPDVSKVVIDRTQDLVKWTERIKQFLPRINPLFGFINNHYAGHSPTNCNQLKQLLGLDTVQPGVGQQTSLF